MNLLSLALEPDLLEGCRVERNALYYTPVNDRPNSPSLSIIVLLLDWLEKRLPYNNRSRLRQKAVTISETNSTIFIKYAPQ